MSLAPIETLISALSNLAAEDKPYALLEVLEGDLQAGGNDWPIAIVAADSDFRERLHSAMPSAVMLRPFNEVVVWSADDDRIIERAGLLVAGSHARQLLPETLVTAIQVADAAGTPILLLVDSMGRTSDPSRARAGIPRQLAAGLPGVPVTFVCLGDSRFEGASLAEAASNAMLLCSPGKKVRALGSFRAQDATTALAARAEHVQLAIRAASENAVLLRATEHGGTILGSAEVGGWRQHLGGYREALAAVDIADVVNTARGQASGAAIVRRAVEELRDRCRNGLKKASKEAEILVLSDLERIATVLTRDLTRAREELASLGVMVEDTKPSLGPLQASIRSKLAEIVDQVVAGVQMSDQILVLAEALGMPQSPAGGTGPTPNSKDKKQARDASGSPKANAQNTPQPDPEDEKLSSRLRRVLANAPERVIAARLHEALDDALGEALARCDQGVDNACSGWGARFQEQIERAFAPLHAASEKSLHATASRLDALMRAMQIVESIHGGG